MEFQASLAAAVGDDVELARELRAAFLESAQRHVEQLAKAANDADWIMAALRLQGLAASFGVDALMQISGDAANVERGSPAMLRRIRQTLADLRD